MYTMGLTNWLD